MPNPYFNSLNNQQNGIDQMLNEINNFRNNFKGDPRAEVEKMLNSGQLSQAQFNQYAQIANQFAKYIK